METTVNEDVYATPRVVTDLADCYFYHTTDIPGVGTVRGEWDLRPGSPNTLEVLIFAASGSSRWEPRAASSVFTLSRSVGTWSPSTFPNASRGTSCRTLRSMRR